MKRFITLLLLTTLILIYIWAITTLTSCERDEDPPAPSVAPYVVGNVSITSCDSGLVFEYIGMSGNPVLDTLVFDHTGDQLWAILFWPPPYEIRLVRK